MNKPLSIGLLLVIATSFSSAFAHSATAQEKWPTPSATSQKYHEYRTAISEPPYGLTKVKALIKKIKVDSEDNRRLPAKDYDALSFDEKFTYTMIHGEDSVQNCDASPPIVDEHKKIFGYFQGPFDNETTWSERQREFLTKNRAKVVARLKSTIQIRKRVGANLKAAMMETNAVELIPDLIAVYNFRKKDHDILTLLMIFMKEGEYKPFLESASFKKLYGETSNYWSFIDASSANQKLTIERAMAFFKTRKAK